MDNTAERLEPCPFCRRTDTLILLWSSEQEGDDWDESNDDCVQVICDASTDGGKGGCGSSSGFRRTIEEAKTLWNTRADSGEAVAWQVRCMTDGNGYWMGWGQCQSEEESAALVKRYEEIGRKAEWRPLYTQPPRATADDDVTEKLWALHMLGPDDVIAAPSRLAADAVAKNFNDYWEAHKHERGHDVHVIATVIEWPYSPLEHARDVIASFAEYADLLQPFDAALSQRVEKGNDKSRD